MKAQLIVQIIMGLSVVGSALSWDEIEKIKHHVLELGIKQFINLYRRWKNRSGDTFKWGDEVCFFPTVSSLLFDLFNS